VSIPPRLIRAFIILALGLVVFFCRPLFAADDFDRDGTPMVDAALSRVYGCISGAERNLCAEPIIVIGTTVLMAIVTAAGRPRAMLIALAFTFPPLLIYMTLYPIWIVLGMIVLMPLMTHAALNSWLPSASKAG
jgi:hypothetical protein